MWFEAGGVRRLYLGHPGRHSPRSINGAGARRLPSYLRRHAIYLAHHLYCPIDIIILIVLINNNDVRYIRHIKLFCLYVYVTILLHVTCALQVYWQSISLKKLKLCLTYLYMCTIYVIYKIFLYLSPHLYR